METIKTKNGEFVLTASQQCALRDIMQFVESPTQRVFILKGYAGTGKTTLVKAVLSEMIRNNSPFVLLASTGRAAKVLTDATMDLETDDEYEVTAASTIHSLIYTFDDINQDLDLFSSSGEAQDLATDNGIRLLFSLKIRDSHSSSKTIYFVDEASMISDEKSHSFSQAQYGSEGRLLKDLLTYDSEGKFIFIGDACQLPPLNQSFSPALNVSYLRSTFNIEVVGSELTEVVRQSDGNDIIQAATRVRKMYFNPPQGRTAWFPFKGYSHIHLCRDEYSLLSNYIDSIREKDYNKATMIVMSNKNVSQLSSIIRSAIGFQGQSISVGDLLLVTQNNMISGLMNGDLVKVISTGLRESRAGLSFVFVQVESLANGRRFSQLLIEDILYAGKTNLSPEQHTHLMIDFHIRMKKAGIKQKTPAYKERMQRDSYLNALRCVYGYALTCHKAQGGEWDNVYLNIPRNMPYMNPRSYVYQWVYTAMTRARQELFTVNDYWVR